MNNYPKAVDDFVHESTRDEPTVQSHLYQIFTAYELDPILQHAVGGSLGLRGSIDIYIPSRDVVIEVKEKDRIRDPHERGKGGNSQESPFEQISRYINFEQSRLRGSLDDLSRENTRSFLGILTDGSTVWMWVFDKHGSVRDDQEWYNRTLNTSDDIDNLIIRICRQKKGKPWAPNDPTPIFKPLKKKFKQHYDNVKHLRSVVTQRNLWKRQLEIAGNPPSPSNEEDQFVLHSMLIIISRGIAGHISDSSSGNEIGLDGFVGWCGEQNWLNLDSGLIDIICTYDWLNGTTDVLRPLYSGLTEKHHRKIFGEFYTPDWLCEAIVNEMLDENWVKDKIRFEHKLDPIDNFGVLDPACGSGTFLYHVVRYLNEIFQKHEVNNIQRRTDLICRLIHGFDIHPVAVEMTRTTVLRALPCTPSVPLEIHQCDSLRTIRKTQTGEIEFNDNSFEFLSSDGVRLSVPMDFLKSAQFAENLDKIVNSAKNDLDLPPLTTDKHLGRHVNDAIRNFHRKLRDVIRKEGDHIWTWYILNQLAAIRLGNRKVDRIIANPPWVRYSNIQVEDRKQEIRDLAEDQNIWPGGKNATAFDIASLFASYCPNLYLNRNKSKCAWVLPYAALKGTNWEKYRSATARMLRQTWDLGNLPFPDQSKSCVRFENWGNFSTKHGDHIPNLLTRRLRKKKGVGRLRRDETWSQVESKTTWEDIVHKFPDSPSEWLDDTGKALARQGASLVPHCLVKIQSKHPNYQSIDISTCPSRHEPWRKFGSLRGSVPRHWIVETVFAENLLHFGTIGGTEVVIPMNRLHSAFSQERNNVKFWNDVSTIYKNNCGKGSTTPKTLIAQIDYNSKFSRQLNKGKSSKRMVIVNSSGEWLVASRVFTGQIVESSIYWICAETTSEAMFLVGILNAECLISAFRDCRNADRHFHTYFWNKVPIPRYNANNQVHCKIVKIVSQAERLTSKVISDLDIIDSKNQPSYTKLREIIRERLRNVGLMAQLDDQVNQILPNHCP